MDEDEELDLDKGSYWYYGPFIQCKNTRCDQRIPLTYPDLPQTDGDQLFATPEIDLLEWPDDEWCVVFGCLKCGHVDMYRGPDVDGCVVPKRVQGRYHNDASLKVVQRSFSFFNEAQIWYSRDPEQYPVSDQFENVIVLSDEF